MATQVTDYDGNDVASQMSSLNITENHYASIQQPQPPSHSQSPVTSTYPNVSTPPARGLAYSAYTGEQQGYPYYSASAGVDQFGGQMGPPVTYPYGAPVELLSHSAPITFVGRSGGGEVYGNQQDHSQGHQQQQGPQANGTPGRQSYRPSHAQTLQQSAQYFGYSDQRQYWMPHQQIFLQKNESKKEYQTRSAQGPMNRISQNPGSNFHQDFNPALRGNFHGQSNLSLHAIQTGQYGLHPAPHFVALTGFPPQFPSQYLGRSSSARKFDDTGVDIFGHIVEFAGDQHGSRFIQQKLEIATPEDRQKLFDEIYPNAYQLMTDVFGNYVTQKMFEHGDQLQKAALAKKMDGRVVQKALDHLLNEQRAKIVAELEPHILECVKSSNANHRMINIGPPQSIPDSFIGHVEELAKHPYGCRVLQKTFENLDDKMKRSLLDEMHEYYVIQSVITVGEPEDRNKIISQLKGRIATLARHKFASNVVEKALIHADPADRRVLINELIDIQPDGTNQVGMLLRDAYANFPLQTGLFAAEPTQREELLEIVLPLLPPLRHTPVGKRIEGRLAQMEDGGAISSVMMCKTLSTSTANTDTNAALSMSRTASSSTVPTSPELSTIHTPNKSPEKDNTGGW
ncbi:pumilio 2 [Cryptococcus deuterogattii 99/473]|uniref:Pumilio 2 n=1 Tax=Cryptococcus deuterogattii Ram5 TaxID=1296110 RepID=A0A0D0TTT0_9TREE|nr:pumilio 2 [Cryptococcus deuterogattii LA55]KIR39183.1 pumilio 2 [Cryptococcus deuterogattii Ram5]KIR94605.1 pumilio 2 [Cryptococcus deuterogattii CBS 10090]KIS00870.1 pumilio 2 [Cryptococcus deuterogattii 2001/935-1]KIY57579.1 pumilio 2 [Cryptococcus deuterogattii 99/473]